MFAVGFCTGNTMKQVLLTNRMHHLVQVLAANCSPNSAYFQHGGLIDGTSENNYQTVTVVTHRSCDYRVHGEAIFQQPDYLYQLSLIKSYLSHPRPDIYPNQL